MSSVIAALSSQRKALEMTQAQLAERSGMNRMSVQKIESGQTDPRLSSIMELARTMGLELLVVPSALRPELDAFVRAGGRYVGQPPGVDAPPSIVDQIRAGIVK